MNTKRKITLTIALVVIIVMFIAMFIALLKYTAFISDTMNDPARFNFTGITANGITLGAEEGSAPALGNITTADGKITGFRIFITDGLDLWVKGVNRASDLSIEGAKNIDDMREFLVGDGKKSWLDKENGVRREIYRDVTREIIIGFEYNDSDGSLIWFTVEQGE